jgi:hypothetical protein
VDASAAVFDKIDSIGKPETADRAAALRPSQRTNLSDANYDSKSTNHKKTEYIQKVVTPLRLQTRL